MNKQGKCSLPWLLCSVLRSARTSFLSCLISFIRRSPTMNMTLEKKGLNFSLISRKNYRNSVTFTSFSTNVCFCQTFSHFCLLLFSSFICLLSIANIMFSSVEVPTRQSGNKKQSHIPEVTHTPRGYWITIKMRWTCGVQSRGWNVFSQNIQKTLVRIKEFTGREEEQLVNDYLQPKGLN